jgi:hypothetical protein
LQFVRQSLEFQFQDEEGFLIRYVSFSYNESNVCPRLNLTRNDAPRFSAFCTDNTAMAATCPKQLLRPIGHRMDPSLADRSSQAGQRLDKDQPSLETANDLTAPKTDESS